jgi:hypothetical protein
MFRIFATIVVFDCDRAIMKKPAPHRLFKAADHLSYAKPTV